MKYMLLIYNRPDFVEDLSDNAREELFAEVDAIMAELTESGELVGGQALTDPSTARTVRQGTTTAHTVTDGPFMESKEQFCGYVEVDVDSRDRAVEIAEIKVGPREERDGMTAPLINRHEIAMAEVIGHIRIIVHRRLFPDPQPWTNHQGEATALKAELGVDTIPTPGERLSTSIGLMHKSEVDESAAEA